MKRPAIISHRGLCRASPAAARLGENTIEAFEAGIAALRNLNMPPAIEFDVRQSLDGTLVVIHDDTLNRTTTGTGLVSRQPMAKLAGLDAGSGRRVPALEAVFDHFRPAADVAFAVEIKTRGIVGRVQAMILERQLAGRCLISAFASEDDAAEAKKNAAPGWDEFIALGRSIPFALLATADRIRNFGEAGFVCEAADRGAIAINADSAATTPSLVARAKAQGLQVNVYTVNTPEEYQRLQTLGVDGVFCDNPHFLL